MDVRVGLWRKLSAEKLMLLNCGVGEDSWESLGLQGHPISPSWRRSVLGVHWKDWCWSWKSNTLVTWCEELTHWKRPDAGRDSGQEEKGTTENEMVGWHHRLNGHGFRWSPRVGDGEGSLACCDSWGHKKSDMTELLNWTELKFQFQVHLFPFLWGQFLELFQVISWVQAGHHVANFSTWCFSIYKTAHRIWFMILSTAVEKELKVLDCA